VRVALAANPQLPAALIDGVGRRVVATADDRLVLRHAVDCEGDPWGLLNAIFPFAPGRAA
jgi:hypothetical protein